MAFTVIDKQTGHYPDCWEIALKEEWAKNLCYCDIEGFAIEEDGTLVLLDECGKVAYCPEGRFRIIPEPQWIPLTERKTGEWCADYDGYSDGEPVYDMWWCSACGEYFDEWDDRPTWKYCPNCGAKMIGGDEDEEPPKEDEA